MTPLVTSSTTNHKVYIIHSVTLHVQEVKDGQLISVKNINQILMNIKVSLNDIDEKIEILKYGDQSKSDTPRVVQSFDDGLNGLVGRAFNILGHVESISHSLDILIRDSTIPVPQKQNT